MNKSPLNYRELIGTPFAYGGRGPDTFDCFGLVKYLIEQDIGRTIPDQLSVTDRALSQSMMTSVAQSWNRIERPVRGCAVLFRVGRYISHVGYVINDFEFIHTWEDSGGVVIEPLQQWTTRIAGFYEYHD